ncbi:MULTISPECIES: hypothetical protein [unclassified Thermosipho (in: thermotogales)]|uniref:hypothetical protein n=1 Tax=unclassified Thermosipho (in: thermotogales) TaxID=2676525 RepID=UPI000987C527|nr:MULTISPECIES: hypothetical protein [unclassified Thermosipho (in: thermotogales)]MBT1247137.1 hypothetical protein [Thermosipho sp. 1244]OOC47110.1 hypothetical protein XO09_03310 [Thermosipho sp. 1223]
MKRFLTFFFIFLLTISFAVKFGFSTQDGVWLRGSIENFGFRLGYPLSCVSFSLNSDIFSYKILTGYVFNNSTYLVNFYFDTGIDNFSFSSYVKSTFHKPLTTETSTETGRIYLGILPDFRFDRLSLGFNVEFSWIYIYYDPGVNVNFLSFVNPEDILRYHLSFIASYDLFENMTFFVTLSTKYKWISYLSTPLFENQFINFGIEVESDGYK